MMLFFCNLVWGTDYCHVSLALVVGFIVINTRITRSYSVLPNFCGSLFTFSTRCPQIRSEKILQG